MTTREVKSLALKFAAIYIVIQFLFIASFSAVSYAWALKQWFGGNVTAIIAAVIGLFAICLPLIMAFILWKQSNYLMQDDLSEPLTSDTIQTSNIADVQAAIFCGVGIFLVGMSIPDVINGVVYLIREASPQRSGLEGGVTWGTALYFLGNTAQLVLGLTLMLGRNGWVRLIYKFRYAGLEK